MRLAAAFLCVCIVLCARAGAQSAGTQSGSLPGGGLYVLHPDPTLATAAIELWYRVPSAGYDYARPGIARVALAAAAAAKLRGGASLSKLVNRAGGSLALEVYPDIAMAGVHVPERNARDILRAMISAFFSLSIDDASLKEAIKDAGVAAAMHPYNTEASLQDRVLAQLFSAGPAHYAPVPESAAAYSALTLEDVQRFAQRAFRQSNVVLSIAGNADASYFSLLPVRGFTGSPAVMDAPYDSTLAPNPGEVMQTGATAGVGFAWAGPPIADERSATALDFIADYLFDPNHGTVSVPAGKRDLYVSGQFVTLHDPGVLIVTISGDGSAAFKQSVLDALTAMQTPLDAQAFAIAQRAFEYHILSQVQTPPERADSNGWYAAEGNAPYAPGAGGAYLKAAESLDAAFIAQTVKKYLQHPAIVNLNTPRPGSTAT